MIPVVNKEAILMQIGRVVGQGVSTVKHPSFKSWRLLVVQPLTADHEEDGEPILAVDGLGARVDDLVILTNDGAGARLMVGARNSPVRWFVLGVRD
jgi:microcompartment protein CcmK/EutM